METQKILNIEKGWGEGSTFFSTNDKVAKAYQVDKITQEERVIGKGYYNDLTIKVYCVYRLGVKICEIEANSSLTIEYSK